MKTKILLFIPMYNCEKQIIKVLDQINETIASYIDEVLIVNNRSTDNGVNVVKEYLKNNKKNVNITLVTNHENYNLGGSHKVAIKYAQDNHFDYLIVLHGDNQANIVDLLPYLESNEYLNYDCLLGSRFTKEKKPKNYSKFRIFGNKIFNVIYSISAKHKVLDMGAGLNMYKVEIFASDYYLTINDSLTFNCEMLLKSYNLRQKIKYIPITWKEDDQKSNVKMFRQSIKTLKIALKNIFSKKSFMTKDNRLNKNYTYECDVIARNFNYKKEKVLITGAAGFIGSQLAYKLYGMGYDLVLIDNFSYGKLDNLVFKDHNFKDEVITMDIRDKEGITNILKNGDVDYIFNIAGIAPLPDNQLDPQNAISVNVGGLANILEQARIYGVKKVVQASTNAMYENETKFPTVETKFNLPTLIYPNTKYCAERFAESYCKTYGMNVSCVRFANVYGPHIDCLRKQPPFVGYLIRELFYDRTPVFHSNGKQRRDYIYVDDLLDLLIRTLRTTGFDCINCSSNNNYSVNEIYDIAKQIMHKDIKAEYKDTDNYWKNYPELYSGVYKISSDILSHEVNKYSLCDNNFARKKYGWIPKVDMKDGLSIVVKETCQYLKQKRI